MIVLYYVRWNSFPEGLPVPVGHPFVFGDREGPCPSVSSMGRDISPETLHEENV